MTARTITSYDPTTRLADDLADWIVTDLPTPCADEIIIVDQKVIIVDSSRFGDLDWSLAHAFAHIDLGHHQVGDPDGAPFSCTQEGDADGMARLMLDMEWQDEAEQQRVFDLPPIDGPPTLSVWE